MPIGELLEHNPRLGVVESFAVAGLGRTPDSRDQLEAVAGHGMECDTAPARVLRSFGLEPVRVEESRYPAGDEVMLAQLLACTHGELGKSAHQRLEIANWRAE